MKILKKIISVFLFVFVYSYIFSGSNKIIDIDSTGIFNEKITAHEKEILESGETLLRSISALKKVCVNNTSQTNIVLDSMSEKIKSGYIAEIINFRKYNGNEDLIERINEIMSDFLSYTDIQFYSEYAEAYFPLYDYAEVIEQSSSKDGKTMTIKEILGMDMFGRFKSQIDVENHGEYFLYKLKNIDKLKYHNFITVVKPEKMCSTVAVFKVQDCWCIYAVGGVDVVRLPFLNYRAEPAFINRVKAFVDFVFLKLDKSGNAKESELDKSDAKKD